ncbi:TonB-dependent receptor [Lysobacteraceae bacterium NML120232]|nr:TonB-dependent receptor [Xanthomonadaceae bacterium NML120232]
MSCFPARRLLVLSICLALSPAAFAKDSADTSSSALDRITVKGERSETKSANANTQTVDADQLEETLANTLEDAIRYIPGVEINDFGQRFGDNGISIRGLSGDRVSMSIDGMQMPESVESLASELYDFFRAGRGAPDIDSLKQIEIAKGADSITAGSAALSGSVSFRTKDPYDYLKPGVNDSYFGLKLAHASVNDENNGTLTLANRTGMVESMLVYTQRRGHEREGWYADSPVATGPDRRIRDPFTYKNHSVLAKVDFVPNLAHRIGLNYERFSGESQIENLSRVQGPSSAYIERWGDDEVQRERYGINWTWTGKNALFDTLELRLGRQQSENIAHTRIYGLSSSCANRREACWRLDDRSSKQTQDQFTLDLDKRWGDAVKHRLIYGLAFQRGEIAQVDYRSFYETDNSITRDPYLQGGRLPDVDSRSWNLYLRDQIRLMDDRLGLTLGARYDSYQYEAVATRHFPDRVGALHQPAKFSAPSWSAGLDWKLDAHNTLWLQTGRGFRAPSASNMFLNLSSSIATNVATGEEVYYWNQASNPNLEAEKSLNLELGWRWQSANAHIGVSVFRDVYDNLITTEYVTRTPDITYQICTGTPPRQTCRTEQGNRYITPVNGLEATIRGFELESMVRLGSAWLLRTAWSQNSGKFADGSPVESISPGRGVLGLRWTSANQKLSINTHITHTLAKKPGDVKSLRNVFTGAYDRPLSHAWTTVDLTANYRPNENWRFNAGIYNVFNREYWSWGSIANVPVSPIVQHGGVSHVGLGRYTAPGRNFRISAAFSF